MNIDINKITKTIIRKNRGLEDPQLIHPARDWSIGIVSTLVVVCLAVGWSVWQYYSYTNLTFDEATMVTMVPYRANQVEEAIARYQARSDIHRAIIMTPSSGASATTTPSEEESSDETSVAEFEDGEESVRAPEQREEMSTPQAITEPGAETNQRSEAEPEVEVSNVPPTLAL